MRLALNVIAAMLIAFSYGIAGGTIASYVISDPWDTWTVTEVYEG